MIYIVIYAFATHDKITKEMFNRKEPSRKVKVLMGMGDIIKIVYFIKNQKNHPTIIRWRMSLFANQSDDW